MGTAKLLAELSHSILPCRRDGLVSDRAAPDAARLQHARLFLRSLPLPIRVVFSVVLWGLWLLSGAAWRGEASRYEAYAAWVRRCVGAKKPLVHSLGLWLKTAACMVVLGAPECRRQLYGATASPVSERKSNRDEASLAEPTSRRRHRRLAKVSLPEADFLVVGSGPAGATVARTLAQAGIDVAILEEGPPTPPSWQADSTLEVLARWFRAGGTTTTTGPERIPLLQGRGVGGSSVVNSAIAWRAPEDVFASWYERDPGLATHLSLQRLDAAYDAIEEGLRPVPTPPSVWGASTALMAEGLVHLGLSGQPTRRYTRGCEGLGRCMEGCPKGHKQSMNIGFIPDALRAGARLYPHCKVERVTFHGTRASGVVACMDGQRGRVVAHRGVILAASCVQTPILLGASGVRQALLGKRFQAHPGVSMAGIFAQPVRRGPLGATQGYDSIAFREQGRFKLEQLNLPDELLASRFPGVGAALSRALAALPYTALWCAQVRADAHGSVRGPLSLPRVAYHFTPRDEQSLGRSVKTLAEMFFAAGAREVLPGVLGYKQRITSVDDLKGVEGGVSPRQVAMIVSHMFGTAVMGTATDGSVCDPYGLVRGCEGLYVADSSLFPTNLGVNPQHTIMALAQHIAWGILEGRCSRATAA